MNKQVPRLGNHSRSEGFRCARNDRVAVTSEGETVTTKDAKVHEGNHEKSRFLGWEIIREAKDFAALGMTESWLSPRTSSSSGNEESRVRNDKLQRFGCTE